MVGKSILPPGARWVEWLGFTGTQYIDTDIVPLNTDTIAGSIGATTTASTYDYAMGARSASAIYMVRRCPTGVGKIGFELNVYGIYLVASNFTVADIPLPLQLKSGNSFIGSVASSAAFSSVSVSPNTFCIGAVKFNGTVTFSSSLDFRLYGLAIERGGLKIIDLRPIAIGTTGYMLDLVSGEYLPYGNKGTGDDFVIGSDIAAPVWGGISANA